MNKSIKIDESILSEVLLKDSEIMKIFIFCLIHSNHKGKKFKSLSVSTGSVVLSESIIKNKLNTDLALFKDKIKKLKSLKLLKFSLIEKSIIVNINNYSDYHLDFKSENKNTIDERKNVFKEKVKSYVGDFNKKVLVSFFSYWTEPNKSGTKMRFELEKTWDIKRRIKTWVRNESIWNSKGFNKPIGLKNHEAFKQKEREVFGHVRSATNMYSIGDVVEKKKDKDK